MVSKLESLTTWLFRTTTLAAVLTGVSACCHIVPPPPPPPPPPPLPVCPGDPRCNTDGSQQGTDDSLTRAARASDSQG